jgi:ATP/maltotriose-dependent transcriptional regulator MalT
MVDFPHKIFVPHLSSHLVSRSRLTDLLNAVTEHRLITVSAPAGYGKTSLLVDFAHRAPCPVSWYTLDSFDQDIWVFSDYLTAAIELRFPGSTKRTSNLLTGSSRATFSEIMSSLAHDIYTIGRDFMLIFDDWHLVDHIADIRQIVSRILLRCPNCHIVLVSRNYPSLPNMMLLTARRQMISINADHLRFTLPEATAVLEEEYSIPFSEEQVTRFIEKSNGWITGILLSHQAKEQPLDLSSPYPSIENRVYSFLVEQVLDQQPPPLRDFLLTTSLLDELSTEPCDALTQRNDSWQQLSALQRRHLFVQEIKPGVLRYHPLFREFLQEYLRTSDWDKYTDLVRRLANQYAAQGLWLLAFDWYLKIDDRGAARQSLAAGSEHLYRLGRLETLEYCFDALSTDELEATQLCLKAQVLIDRGRHKEAQLLILLAETRVTTRDDDVIVMLLKAQLARVSGEYEQAIELAQQAQRASRSITEQAMALRIVGVCYNRLGDPDRAIQEFETALALQRERGDLYEIAQLRRDLGLCYTAKGMLHIAADYYMQSDAYWTSLGNPGLHAMSLNSIASVQHLAGQYHDAYTNFASALQFAREAAMPVKEAVILSCLGDLYSDLQLWEQAQAAYKDAHQIATTAHTQHDLHIAEIRLQVRQGNYENAAQRLRQLPAAVQRTHTTSVLLLLGAVAEAQAQHGLALEYAQRVIALVWKNQASMDVARAHLLQANIVAQTDHAALLAHLQQAADIAARLGHDAFLLIETLSMRNVLRRAAALGWATANNWLERHQDIFRAAEALTQQQQLPLIVVRTLGIDQIIFQGQPITVGWQKAREVFYYLLAHPQGATIEALCQAIWLNRDGQRSREALRMAIYQLRSAISRDIVELHRRQVYSLNRQQFRIDYDVERFLRIIDSYPNDPEMLSSAFELYHGAYLVSSPNEWCVSLRSFLEQRYLYALHQTATLYESRHMVAEALVLYQRILSVDVLDEKAHTGLMRCYLAVGNRGAAVSQYQTLRRILDEELGFDTGNGSEAELLYRQILATS